jgi:DtxR family transcriptional regulator, Mn-dependent transcriptional regulator
MKMENIKITPSLEDYIETAFLVFLDKGFIRLTDISRKLGVKKSSVAHALNHLLELDFIKKKKYGQITLTENGILNGKKILSKHSMIKKFLTEVLGVSLQNAENDACSIEHIISEESLLKIKEFLRRKKKYEN